MTPMTATRPTDDVDAVVDVRAEPAALLSFTTVLSELGFVSAGETWIGHQHRWTTGRCSGRLPSACVGRHPTTEERPVTPTSYTSTGIAFDRAGPRGELPVVLIHAGVADRRMWDPVWPALTAERDAVKLDLRGFGESATRPDGALSPVADVLNTVTEIGVGRCHLVGASFGAGVAVEVALTRPELVASMLLSAPGGSLIGEVTPDLRAFIEAERTALAAGDLEAAVEANLTWWVDGPRRDAGDVDRVVRDLVRQMQLRAFQVTADWDDVQERELDPPALDQLADLRVPTLVLVGALDLDAIAVAARRVADGISGARLVDWPDTAHLPSSERPTDFLALLRDWLTPSERNDVRGR
jgi:3-oxoadipate enol-lactonase